jgi:hypothetical protein
MLDHDALDGAGQRVVCFVLSRAARKKERAERESSEVGRGGTRF